MTTIRPNLRPASPVPTMACAAPAHLHGATLAVKKQEVAASYGLWLRTPSVRTNPRCDGGLMARRRRQSPPREPGECQAERTLAAIRGRHYQARQADRRAGLGSGRSNRTVGRSTARNRGAGQRSRGLSARRRAGSRGPNKRLPAGDSLACPSNGDGYSIRNARSSNNNMPARKRCCGGPCRGSILGKV
jgi:hypothetical protein